MLIIEKTRFLHNGQFISEKEIIVDEEKKISQRKYLEKEDLLLLNQEFRPIFNGFSGGVYYTEIMEEYKLEELVYFPLTAEKQLTEKKSQVCIYVFTRGVNKGGICGLKISEKSTTGQHCTRHLKLEMSDQEPRIIPKKSEYRDQTDEKKINYVYTVLGPRFVFSKISRKVCGVEIIVDEEKKISRVEELNAVYREILDENNIPTEERSATLLSNQSIRAFEHDDGNLLYYVSDQLAEFMGIQPGSSRTHIQVLDNICNYIERENLRSSENQHLIIPDEKLRNLLDYNQERDGKLPFHGILGGLSRHFMRADDRRESNHNNHHGTMVERRESRMENDVKEEDGSVQNLGKNDENTKISIKKEDVGKQNSDENKENQDRKGGTETSVENERLCKVCFDRKWNILFLPCSHLCACEGCAEQLTKCPMCRTQITRTKKVFPC